MLKDHYFYYEMKASTQKIACVSQASIYTEVYIYNIMNYSQIYPSEDKDRGKKMWLRERERRERDAENGNFSCE